MLLIELEINQSLNKFDKFSTRTTSRIYILLLEALLTNQRGGSAVENFYNGRIKLYLLRYSQMETSRPFIMI